MRWADQKIVIVGGTSGIGLATARMLVHAEATVFVASRLRSHVDEALADLGSSAAGDVVDAASIEDLQVLFRRVGPFDHLILTLSVGEGWGAFRTLDFDRLSDGFNAKFWPQLHAARASLGTLRSDGSITFVTAISARTAILGAVGPAAINGALESLIAPLALELKPLRVNAVSPGMTATAYWNRLPDGQRAAMFKQSAQTMPVGRVGQADEIAQAIVFLVASTFITGTVIECDGGLHIV